ncbi:MAG: hypothetical protein PVH68_03090 [Armatimonadota bacterium]
MPGFLRKLFGGESSEDAEDAAASHDPHDANPVATAAISTPDDATEAELEEAPSATAGCWEHEESKPEYEEFCAGFCFKPGTKLMEYLESEGPPELRSWLHWETREAEPKAFIRLMLQLMREGQNIWDQLGITFFLDGRWSEGGGPSMESSEAMAMLADVLGKQIKYIYQETPAGDAEYMMLVYDP